MTAGFEPLGLPHLYSLRNRFRFREQGAFVKTTLLGLLGLAFWAGLFVLSCLVLNYFAGVEIFGPILAKKLLSMVFLTFFFVLLYSNIITALSTYFLSEDLPLILSTPVSVARVYGIKLLETTVNSSWMVVIFATPVFLAYAVVFRASAGYFFQLFALSIPFVLIPACMGIMLTMTLILVFPARRLKDLLFVIGLVIFVSLFIFLRLLRPERLMDSEVSQGLLEYLAAVQAPSSILLPSYWATEALSPFLFPHEHTDAFFYLALLVSTALAMVVLGNGLSEGTFTSGWSKAQEAGTVRPARLQIVDRLISGLPSSLSSAWRGMMIKDIKAFFRDTTQWSQLLLLLALVVIYLYNFRVLPLKSLPLATFLLKNVVSYLNLALAGFVLSAVGARFVFPAVSLEGKAFWMIRSAPVSLRSFLWSKFWVSLIPLLLLAEILVLITNLLLEVGPLTMVLSMGTIFVLTLGITSLGVGMGAIYPRFGVANPASISTGFGGIVYMIVCLIYIGIVVAAVAWPAYIFLDAQLRSITLSNGFWFMAALVWVFLVFINCMAVWLPMRLGVRHLSNT